MTSTNYCFSFWPTGWVTMERRSLSAPYQPCAVGKPTNTRQPKETSRPEPGRFAMVSPESSGVRRACPQT